MNAEYHRYCGHSIAEAERYGMPCIGSTYGMSRNDDVNDYVKVYGKGVKCVCCGDRAVHVHHYPPKSKGYRGTFTLRTPMGWHILKPALFALCEKCHNQFHANTLKADWVWNTEDDREAWWSGKILTRCIPNSKKLYEYGMWHFYGSGRDFYYKEVLDGATWKAVRK